LANDTAEGDDEADQAGSTSTIGRRRFLALVLPVVVPIRQRSGATGTVVRPNERVVDVTTFAGVDPTGSSDSSAGLQRAVDALDPTSGGVLLFPPGANLVVSRTVRLPAWETEDKPHYQLRLTGYGARVLTRGDNAILSRTASGAAERDADRMARRISGGAGWKIEGLTFSGDMVPGSTALQLDSMLGLLLENVSFEGLDVGADLRWCLNTLFLTCRFTNCRTYGYRLGTVEKAGLNYSSNACGEIRSRHFCRAGQRACVFVHQSSEYVSTAGIFEGDDPEKTIEVQFNGHSTSYGAHIADAHIEHIPRQSFLHAVVAGNVVVERAFPQSASTRPYALVDATGARGGQTVIVRDLHHAPESLRMKGEATNAALFYFQNAHLPDWTDPKNWIDGVRPLTVWQDRFNDPAGGGGPWRAVAADQLRPANPYQLPGPAADAASTQALANELRNALVRYGLAR
jgi:hypothetical protein